MFENSTSTKLVSSIAGANLLILLGHEMLWAKKLQALSKTKRKLVQGINLYIPAHFYTYKYIPPIMKKKLTLWTFDAVELSLVTL